MRFKNTPPRAAVILISAIALSSCAVRDHHYVCLSVASHTPDSVHTGSARISTEEEMLLTPTSLRIASRTYLFSEEQARVRIYHHKESGSTAIFDPFSNRLNIEQTTMQCRRLESF
jgi:hypothetical protein